MQHNGILKSFQRIMLTVLLPNAAIELPFAKEDAVAFPTINQVQVECRSVEMIGAGQETATLAGT
jgi:hypothetical protein